jgi:DNA-binding response OmpR family regulator
MQPPGTILDREPATVATIAEILRDEGYRPDHAYGRASTLAAIDQHMPGLVWLDHTLADLPKNSLRAHLALQYDVAIPSVTLSGPAQAPP